LLVFKLSRSKFGLILKWRSDFDRPSQHFSKDWLFYNSSYPPCRSIQTSNQPGNF
jgi:hypothetical protein